MELEALTTPLSILEPIHLAVFGIAILVFLYFDLVLIHNQPEDQLRTRSSIMVLVGILISLLFNGFIWWSLGDEKAIDFLTGYVIEKFLSVDNLFIFIVIFRTLQVTSKFQHRTLFYGIFGAYFSRVIMILSGIDLLEKFKWLPYFFGALLVYAGAISIFDDERKESKVIKRLTKKMASIIPISHKLHGEKFLVRIQNRIVATPLLISLIGILITDFIFALDAIPAIFAITPDPFIVITSNLFALLGLRSLYFTLVPFLKIYKYLHHGVGAILIFIGIKYLTANIIHISSLFSLIFILSTLAISILNSIRAKKSD